MACWNTAEKLQCFSMSRSATSGPTSTTASPGGSAHGISSSFTARASPYSPSCHQFIVRKVSIIADITPGLFVGHLAPFNVPCPVSPLEPHARFWAQITQK